MNLARWSPRTVLWLWTGVLACYAVVITIGVLKVQKERRALAHAIDLSVAAVQDTDSSLSPPQLARRDSLVDSLRQLGETFIESPEGRAMITGVLGALTETSREATRSFVIPFALFLSPALIMLLLTVTWWRARRAILRSAGA